MRKWVTFCRRTNDPKLAYLEHRLTEAEIPHRRNGDSWHAPILEVPKEYEEQAETILAERRGRYRLDDVRDDHPSFYGYKAHDWTDEECPESPMDMGWIGKDGRP